MPYHLYKCGHAYIVHLYSSFAVCCVCTSDTYIYIHYKHTHMPTHSPRSVDKSWPYMSRGARTHGTQHLTLWHSLTSCVRARHAQVAAREPISDRSALRVCARAPRTIAIGRRTRGHRHRADVPMITLHMWWWRSCCCAAPCASAVMMMMMMMLCWLCSDVVAGVGCNDFAGGQIGVACVVLVVGRTLMLSFRLWLLCIFMLQGACARVHQVIEARESATYATLHHNSVRSCNAQISVVHNIRNI